MMVDSDLGADLSTMFMVQYEQGGFAGAHDHPLEETYQILDGGGGGLRRECLPPRARRRGLAGVGCVHEFRNIGPGTCDGWRRRHRNRPPRHSYRFARDWRYLHDT